MLAAHLGPDRKLLVTTQMGRRRRKHQHTVLAELSTDISRGYRIAFVNPPTYRIDMGRFRIHFRFDDRKLEVAFIGVY